MKLTSSAIRAFGLSSLIVGGMLLPSLSFAQQVIAGGPLTT